jgi:hypothetical protein
MHEDPKGKYVLYADLESTVEESIAPLLTIAVPTYNRPEKFRECVEAILPELSKDVHLEIYDDGSDYGDEYKSQPFTTVFHNTVNFGPHVNILLIAASHGEGWLLIVGDDDVILDSGIHTALELIELIPDAVHIGTEKVFDRYICNKGEFFSDISPTDLWGLSPSLWNMSILHPYLPAGFHQASAMLPLPCALFACMQEEYVGCYFTTRKLVRSQPFATWSRRQFVERSPMILDVLTPENRAKQEPGVVAYLLYSIKFALVFQNQPRSWVARRLVVLVATSSVKSLLCADVLKATMALLFACLFPVACRRRLIRTNQRYQDFIDEESSR